MTAPERDTFRNAFQATSEPVYDQPAWRAGEVRSAWIALLDRWRWDLAGHHTFREEVHPEAAEKHFRKFISILNRKLYGPRWFKHGAGVRWACATERQGRGVLHLHSLLVGRGLVEFHAEGWWRDGEQLVNALNEIWDSLAGFARIGPIRSKEASLRYVTKDLSHGGEILLGGPGTFETRRTRDSAGVRRYRSLQGADKVKMRMLRSVTTDIELRQLESWAKTLSGSPNHVPALVKSVRERVRTNNPTV